MVRFVNDFCSFFCFFVIVGCTLDIGLMSGEEMRQLVSGAIVHGSYEENELAVKVCLELISTCCNMSKIRVGATDSALQYLLNNTTTNDFKRIKISRESQPSLHHLTTVLLLLMVSQLKRQVSVVRLRQRM